MPQLRRLAILFNADNTQPVLEMGETQAEARRLGLEVAIRAIRRAEDIAPAFKDLRAQADAVYVTVDQLIVANRTRIIAAALNERLPGVKKRSPKNNRHIIIFRHFQHNKIS